MENPVNVGYTSAGTHELWVWLQDANNGFRTVAQNNVVLSPGAGTMTFTLTVAGDAAAGTGYQWVARMLPQGWSTVDDAIAIFTQAASVQVDNPGGGSDEYAVTPDVIALYHFNGNYKDASANGISLSSTGGVQRISSNLDWMANPAGEVVRFSEAGDTLSVSIPDSLVTPNGDSSITVEARIFVRGYKGWGVGNLPIIDLTQDWDCNLGVRDRKWGEPRGPNIWGNAAEVVNAQDVANLLTLNQWHLVQLSYDGSSGDVTARIDGTVAGSTNKPLNASRTSNWTLTLGNFNGDIDEVVLRQSAEPSSTEPPLPDTTSPTVALSGPSGTVTGAFVVNAGFSEAVTGFDASDLAATGGVISAVSGAGNSFSFVVTPLIEGTVTVRLPAGTVVDLAGNPNTASNIVSVVHEQPVTGGGGDEDAVAIYTFGGNFDDSSGNGYHLLNAGGVSLVGGAARFSGAGQSLTVSIPDSVLQSAAQAMSIETRILPRNYVGWSNDNFPMVSLYQDWDSSLQLHDNIWAADRAPAVSAGILELVSPSDWKTLAPAGQWHTLKISYDGIGTVDVLINGSVVSSTAWQPTVSRNNDWVLTLGNIDGDLDDVKVRTSVPPSFAGRVAGDASTVQAAGSILGFTQGLTAEYYEGEDFNQLRTTRIDSSIDFDWGASSPGPQVSADGFSVRWRGCISPTYTETFILHATADEGVRVWVDDVLVINQWGAGTVNEHTANVDLRAGIPAVLVFEYVERSGDALAKLEWSSPRQSREVIPPNRFTMNESNAQQTILASYPGSWGEWVASARSNGTNLSTPGANIDGDYFVDLLEYALGESPGTGIAATSSAGMRLETEGPAENVSVSFRRPSAVGDLQYIVETSADGNHWSALDFGPNVTISRHRDGTETVRYSDVDGDSSLTESGFARLRVDLEGSAYSATTQPCGWYRTALHKGYQSLGISLIKPAILAGRIDESFGESISYLGGGDLMALFEDGQRYYLEVRSGSWEGHRIGIDTARSTSTLVVFDPTASGNTLDELPAETRGAAFAIRPHHTLGEFLAKERLTAGRNPSTTDQVHFYRGDRIGYDSYFLLDAGDDLHYWTTLSNASLADGTGTIIVPGEGIFLERAASDPVTLTTTGVVRLGAFVQPLHTGYNFIAEPFPYTSSPSQRRLLIDNGIRGSIDPSDADQIHVWRGDDNEEVESYSGYFLLDAGEGSGYRYWTELSNAALLNHNDSRILKPGRAAFFLRRGNAMEHYEFKRTGE
jgi:hypothetical protein